MKLTIQIETFATSVHGPREIKLSATLDGGNLSFPTLVKFLSDFEIVNTELRTIRKYKNTLMNFIIVQEGQETRKWKYSGHPYIDCKKGVALAPCEGTNNAIFFDGTLQSLKNI